MSGVPIVTRKHPLCDANFPSFLIDIPCSISALYTRVSAPLALFFIFYMAKPVEWVWYSMMLSTVVAFTIAVLWLFSTVRKLPIMKLES